MVTALANGELDARVAGDNLEVTGFSINVDPIEVPPEVSPASTYIVRGGAADRPLEQLRPAAEALIQLVDAYQLLAGVDANVFDVMGFSQGAAMSNLLAFLYPQRIRKTGILAGFVPSRPAAQVTELSAPLEAKNPAAQTEAVLDSPDPAGPTAEPDSPEPSGPAA